MYMDTLKSSQTLYDSMTWIQSTGSRLPRHRTTNSPEPVSRKQQHTVQSCSPVSASQKGIKNMFISIILKLCFQLFVFIRIASRRQPPIPENWIERKRAGVLGPTRSNLAVIGLELGRTKLGPNLRRTRASWQVSPTAVQHGATWARFDASWA